MDKFSVNHVIGGISLLCLQNSTYSQVPIGFLYSRWSQSLFANNFFYLELANGQPAGFIVWKFCPSEEILKEVKGTNFPCQHKLKDGDYIFVMDIICSGITPMWFGRQIRQMVVDNSNIKGVVYSKNVSGVYKSFLRLSRGKGNRPL